MSRPIIIIFAVVILGTIVIASLVALIFLNQGSPNLGPAPSFQLENQDNQLVTLANFTGKVVVINFIYTLCTDKLFCPLSTYQMSTLEALLLLDGYNASQFHLLTVSFDWVHDNASTMKAYGLKYGANFTDWSFLSGTSQQLNQSIYAFTCNDSYGFLPHCIPPNLQPKLAPNNVPAYNVVVAWDYNANVTDFLHYSTPLVIIDQKGQIKFLDNNYSLKDLASGNVYSTDQWDPANIAKNVESVINS